MVIDKTRTGYSVNLAGVSNRPVRGIRQMASAGERRVAAAGGFDPALGFLPVLLAAEGGQVEQGVGAAEGVGPAAVGRVGVEDLVAVPEEAAEAGEFGGPLVV